MTPDRLLRQGGFAIVGRPVDGEPLWRDCVSRRVYSQETALAIAQRRLAAQSPAEEKPTREKLFR